MGDGSIQNPSYFFHILIVKGWGARGSAIGCKFKFWKRRYDVVGKKNHLEKN